jgi:hypothetical protein
VSQYIRTNMGVPTVSMFDSKEGTPLIIDLTTGVLYYLFQQHVMPVQGGPPPTFNGFSSGFSDGFS